MSEGYLTDGHKWCKLQVPTPLKGKDNMDESPKSKVVEPVPVSSNFKTTVDITDWLNLGFHLYLSTCYGSDEVELTVQDRTITVFKKDLSRAIGKLNSYSSSKGEQ